MRTGAAKGLAVLNKYYLKTDESIMYRCTMSTLHYSSVLTFILMQFGSASSKVQTGIFLGKKWPKEWIKTTKTVLREQWLTDYKSNDSPELMSSQMSSSSNAVCHFQLKHRQSNLGFLDSEREFVLIT